MMLRAIARPACLYARHSITPTTLLPVRWLAQPLATSRTVRIQKRMQTRPYATMKSEADERIEEIQEQYAYARDEFEIAVEETEKQSIYAADDRAAAADQLAKLKELYEAAIHDSSPEIAKEIQSRVGQRIRELDQAIQGLEKSAIEDAA